MTGSVQVIKRKAKPEWAVLPYEMNIHLVEEAELLQQLRDCDSIKLAIDQGQEELIPGEVYTL